MHTHTIHRNRAFSLIELVIVVVILGIIGAIAIPRMSRGAAGAADSAVVSDLAVLRSAIDLYNTEHSGAYPTLAAFEAQLTQYSDINGNTSATKDTTHIYGPYLRAIPKQKVGPNKGYAGVTDTQGTANFGWWYTAATGTIKVNAADSVTDERGVAYTSY